MERRDGSDGERGRQVGRRYPTDRSRLATATPFYGSVRARARAHVCSENGMECIFEGFGEERTEKGSTGEKTET